MDSYITNIDLWLYLDLDLQISAPSSWRQDEVCPQRYFVI